jgi:hypothetical protein
VVGESNVGVDAPNPPEPKAKAERPNPKEVGVELGPSSPKSETKYIFWKRGKQGMNSHLEL